MRKLTFLALMGIAMFINAAYAQKIYDFTSVEKAPEYPGGISKFYEYLGGSIKYPEVAKNNKIQGKVFVSFVVNQDGKLTDVTVTRGLSPETDAEALRVINNSPKWNPGMIKGKPVRVKYNLNVNFSLSPKGADQKMSSDKTMNKLPEYPGGNNKLYSFLAKHIKYPKQAQKDHVQGKVMLSFNVEKDGTLTNIKVIKGVSKEIDAEAIRVIKASPRWNPQIGADGKPVISKYVMPINFSLS